jgi:aryl carrier-like protein
MAITLAEAKATLSVYVDNGVYQDDSRVVARINEAQRRLYAVRSWLGVLAKYSVPVTAGTFTLPDTLGATVAGTFVPDISTFAGFGINTILRVTTTTMPNGFLTNSEQAFLSNSESLVKVNKPASSSNFRSYQVSGINPLPASVEITGKLNFVPATAANDLLIIQDLDALRLMLLALWREQNGQLDLAQAFEQKAVERLSMVLDKTLEGARRLNYQSIVATSVEGSMGWMRSRMALDLKDGLHTDDAALFHLVDKAEEYLLTRGSWYGSIRQFDVQVDESGEIYLPHEVESILFCSFNSERVDLFAREYDFHENGPGYRTAKNASGLLVVDRGEDAVFDANYGGVVAKRKIFVNRPTNPEDPCILTILGSIRFSAKTNDSDPMVVGNYPAMLEMVTAFMQSDKPDFYTFHEQKAIQLLRDELQQKRGGNRLTMQVQGTAWAMGDISNLR